MPAANETAAPESELRLLVKETAEKIPALKRVAGKVVILLGITNESAIYGRPESHLAGRRYCAPFELFDEHAEPVKDVA